MSPGVYQTTMAEYMAIQAVNAGAIHATVTDCPQRGWLQSAFNPNRRDDWSDRSDRGTIAHAILFEGGFDAVQVFDPSNYPNAKGPGVATGWSNKAIREARAECRASGKIPILRDDYDTVESMVRSAVFFIDSLKDSEPAIWSAFQGNSDRELTCVWDDRGTLCKMRPDLMTKDRRLIIDGKFTETSANPEVWGRAMLGKMGYRTGAGWYRRGAKALFGEKPEYVFLVVEQEPPHLCSLVGLNPEQYAKADGDASFGLNLWQACAGGGVPNWPSYPKRVSYPEMSSWERAEMESMGCRT